MTDADLVAVRTYLTRIDAELARTALEDGGIESMIRSDDAGGMCPHLWMGGIALLVRREDVDRAEQLLADAERATESAGESGESAESDSGEPRE